MSIFYLTPVKGDIPLHLLEEIIVRRLEHLKAVLKGDPIVYDEYVVDGSIYDNVGHFTLCIAAVLSENKALLQFYLRSEVVLFTRRLSGLSAYDLRSFSKKVCRSLKKNDHNSNLDPLKILCQHFVLKNVAHHISSTLHCMECSVHHINLHFKHCLSFIANRQVEVSNGMAVIPCGMWKMYLKELFKNNLKYRMNQINFKELKSDPRILELLVKIKKVFPLTTNDNKMLTSVSVDQASEYFPPCMRNLHISLRKKHRLSHIHRFHYSLFLKDIGMPVNEAIDFWRAEYSQSTNGGHSCCHNWSRDEKKFVYGIRHMYGLEGGRKNYASVNCSCIQTENSSEGGCPFKCFDGSKLVQLLDNPKEIILSQINVLKRKRQYTSACMMYLKDKGSIPDCDNFSFTFTPVRYYSLATRVQPMEL